MRVFSLAPVSRLHGGAFASSRALHGPGLSAAARRLARRAQRPVLILDLPLARGVRTTLEIMLDESGVPNRNLRWSALDERAMLLLQTFLAMYMSMFRPISVFAVSCCIRYSALITRRFGSVDFGLYGGEWCLDHIMSHDVRRPTNSSAL